MDVDASTSSAVPVKPIELDSDFSGEDEYEDDTGDEGKSFIIVDIRPILLDSDAYRI